MSHTSSKPSHEELRKQAEIVYSLLSMLSSNENLDEPPLVALLHDKNSHAREKDTIDMSSSALEALMKLSFDDKQRQAICYLGGLQAIALMLIKSNKEFGSTTCDENVIRSRLHACMSLTNLTFGFAKNKSILCSIGEFVVTVVDQLKSPNEELRRVAACVLRNLSWKADADAKIVMKDAKIVAGLLTAAMEAEKESTLKCILDALWNISAHSVENKAEICDFAGSLEFIVSLLTYLSPTNTTTIIENGGGILRNISSHIAVNEQYRMILRRQNCFEILLKHLQSNNQNIVSNACGTLWNLSARCIEDQQTLWRLGTVRFLGNLVDSDNKAIAIASSAALKNLLLYKSNTSSLFTSCSSSPVEEKGKENKSENCENSQRLLNAINNTNKMLIRQPADVNHNNNITTNSNTTNVTSLGNIITKNRSTECLKVVNMNTINQNEKSNSLRRQGQPLKTNSFNNNKIDPTNSGIGIDIIDDSVDEPIDFSRKFKEINLENIINNDKQWINDFAVDKTFQNNIPCNLNNANNETNLGINNNNNSNNNNNNFSYHFPNIKDPRILQLQLQSTTKEIPDVVRQISSLCSAYKNNSGYSSPVELPKLYCTEDTPDGFSIANGSICDITEFDTSKNDYFQYASSNPVLNFNNNVNSNVNSNNKFKYNLVNKLPVHSNQISIQNFNQNTSKLLDYYEEAKDEPIDFSIKYQEILPDKYPSRMKWPCEGGFGVYKQQQQQQQQQQLQQQMQQQQSMCGHPISTSHVILKDQTSPLSTSLAVHRNTFPICDVSQKENTNMLDNKCLNVGQSKILPGSTCSPNDVPKQYYTEDTPIGYSRASSLSSLSMKSSELEHTDHAAAAKSHAEKSAEPTALPSIKENEALSITPMDSKLNLQGNNKSTGKSSGSSESNSGHHNSGGPKTVTFDETNQTPMMFSRCSSLGSLSSFDARSVHSSVISEYSRRASGIVSPSDLPDSPGGTMPPSPKTNKSSGRISVNYSKQSERSIIPVGHQETCTKNDSDCSLSDNEDGYDDDLLSEVIQSAMPKNKRHSRITYEVVNQCSDGHNVKTMVARKPFMTGTESHVIGKTYIHQQLHNQLIVGIDANQDMDTMKTYAVEGTPLEISRFTSLSDLSIDDSVNGKKNKKETNNPRRIISVQPSRTFVETQNNALLEDSLKTYNFEGTPINFSRNDSLSSLGSKDFSSPGKPDTEVHPKLKKIFLRPQDGANSTGLQKNITSTPCGKTQVALGDEVLRYAVEGTPDKIPPISYEDTSLGADNNNETTINKDTFDSQSFNQASKIENGNTSTENDQQNKTSSSTSSSLSFDSSDSDDDDDSPIKNDLLQECINAALPKGKVRKTKQKTNWNRSQDNNTFHKNTTKIASARIPNLGPGLRNNGKDTPTRQTDDSAKDRSQAKSDSLKRATFVTNALNEPCTYSEEDDYSMSGPSTEANNTVIYRGQNDNPHLNGDELNVDILPIEDALNALNSVIDEADSAKRTLEDEESPELGPTSAPILEEIVSPFSIDSVNLLSSHSLNLPGLILTEENSTALNLSVSLMSKSADPIPSVRENRLLNKSNNDLKEFSDLIDNFYYKTRLQDLESSRFDMKSVSTETTSNDVSKVGGNDLPDMHSSISSNSSIPNSMPEDGMEKKTATGGKNKLLNFFRKHSLRKLKSTGLTKKSDPNITMFEVNGKVSTSNGGSNCNITTTITASNSNSNSNSTSSNNGNNKKINFILPLGKTSKKK